MYLLLFRQRQGFPLAVAGFNMVPRGLEPRILRLLAVRSNQLSYETLNQLCKTSFPELLGLPSSEIFHFRPPEILRFCRLELF